MLNNRNWMHYWHR